MKDEKKLKHSTIRDFFQTNDEEAFLTIILLFYFENFFNFLQNLAFIGIIEDRRQFDYFLITLNEKIVKIIKDDKAFKKIKKLYTDFNLLDVIASDLIDFFEAWEFYYGKQMNQILIKIKQIASSKGVLGKSYPQIAEMIIDSEIFSKKAKDGYSEDLEFFKQMKIYLSKNEEFINEWSENTIKKEKERLGKQEAGQALKYFDLEFDFENGKFWQKDNPQSKKAFRLKKKKSNKIYLAGFFQILLEKKGKWFSDQSVFERLEENDGSVVKEQIDTFEKLFDSMNRAIFNKKFTKESIHKDGCNNWLEYQSNPKGIRIKPDIN